jgi:histidine triad (HIT) family protein
MSDCLFCKIISGEIPSAKVYEDEYVYAFKDINPVAPVHTLVVPKKHICCLDGVADEDEALMGKVMLSIKKVASLFPECENGYRVINNCGENGGQTVKHLHFHIIGGVKLSEKLI